MIAQTQREQTATAVEGSDVAMVLEDDPFNLTVQVKDLYTTADVICATLTNAGIPTETENALMHVNGIFQIVMKPESHEEARQTLLSADLITDERVDATKIAEADQYLDSMFVTPPPSLFNQPYIPPDEVEIQLAEAVFTLTGDETPIVTKRFRKDGTTYFYLQARLPTTIDKILNNSRSIVTPDGAPWSCVESAYNDNKLVTVQIRGAALTGAREYDIRKALQKASIPYPYRVRLIVADRSTMRKRPYGFVKYLKDDIMRVRDQVLGQTFTFKGPIKFADDINTRRYRAQSSDPTTAPRSSSTPRQRENDG